MGEKSKSKSLVLKCVYSFFTKKRDPSTFRTQLTTIISLLRREFDRVGFPATYFTTTEDINATLRMVEKQLWGLTHKVKMKDVEQTEKDQLKQLKDSLKRVKTKVKEIKKEFKKCYKSHNRNNSDDEDCEVEGGEGTQDHPSQSNSQDRRGTRSPRKQPSNQSPNSPRNSPDSRKTKEPKSQENE